MMRKEVLTSHHLKTSQSLPSPASFMMLFSSSVSVYGTRAGGRDGLQPAASHRPIRLIALPSVSVIHDAFFVQRHPFMVKRAASRTEHRVGLSYFADIAYIEPDVS